MRRILPALALLTAACGDERPPAPTRQQSDHLNEAEAMLDEMGKEKGPENRSPGPSSSSD